MPSFLVAFASCIKRVLFWIFDDESAKVVPDKDKEKANDSEPGKVKLFMVTNDIPQDKVDANNTTDSPSEKKEESDKKLKCNNCDLCENCQKDKDKEKDKKKKKDKTEANVSALNYFMCFVLFITMLVCNLTLWLLIAYPPANY